ncbi:hypothetical protein BDY24DRAFT_417774 [Mrakia frigida]|uniref:uncharacterized protein n=1 Tax=Mrakia frigida TaxID=29902 RepID=UPI003FCC0B4E
MLPWEMLQHIFSHCDQPTPFAISLVSFGCWELATNLVPGGRGHRPGRARFVETVPSSPRLQQATPLLSRIRSLSIFITDWDQSNLLTFNAMSSFLCGRKEGEKGIDAVRRVVPGLEAA